MEKLRLFVAAFPPDEVVKKLTATMQILQKAVPQRAVAWTEPEKIHITLHFLGGVESGKIGAYQEALARVCDAASPFSLRAGGLGCFPGPQRPRILWVGLRENVEALRTLHGRLEPEFVQLGYSPEARPFHPHLTMGRVKELNPKTKRALCTALIEHQATDFGEWPVRKIELMQSVLDPAGARYSVVKSFLLSQPPL